MAGLYIHIPYCRSKCYYCDFYSRPTGGADISNYVEALLQEWHMRCNEIDEVVSTVYIGGGTPSLMDDKLLVRLIDGLSEFIDFSSLKEFTFEANPEDINDRRIELWQSMGINRVSIGIQSFKQSELDVIGRRHRSSVGTEALKLLSAKNINYNADLIYGLPDQTLQNWKDNLCRLLDYNPPHFSAYLLSYEPGTRLTAMRDQGRVNEASEELACAMYEMLCEVAIQAGYNHYEISNFSKPGLEAIHNSSYWNYTPYIGLGVSAHSFDGTVRRFNPNNLKRYLASMNNNRTYYETDDENTQNRFNDYLITSLRTRAGFSPSFAMRTFSHKIVEEFYANLNKLNTDFKIKGKLAPIIKLSDDALAIPEQLWLKSDAILRDLIV